MSSLFTKICDQLKELGLKYEVVMDDSIHVVNANVCKESKTKVIAASLISDIDNEVKWIEPEMIRNRANQALSRRKAYLLLTRSDGQKPYYGHYTGSVTGHALHDELSEDKPHCWSMFDFVRKFESNVNHLIATKYINQDDHMPGHSDKTQDLIKGSFIWDFSIGAKRQLVFTDVTTDKHVHTVQLTNGSLFILGPKTNSRCSHSVPESKIPCGERISIIIRSVASHKSVSDMNKLVNQHLKTQTKNADKPCKPRKVSNDKGKKESKESMKNVSKDEIKVNKVDKKEVSKDEDKKVSKESRKGKKKNVSKDETIKVKVDKKKTSKDEDKKVEKTSNKVEKGKKVNKAKIITDSILEFLKENDVKVSKDLKKKLSTHIEEDTMVKLFKTEVKKRNSRTMFIKAMAEKMDFATASLEWSKKSKGKGCEEFKKKWENVRNEWNSEHGF